MKLFLALLLFFAVAGKTTAQVISYDDFKSVIPLLQKEDFKGAFEKTSQLLATTKKDPSDLHCIVTYMNIFSAAGMVSVSQMTNEDFLKNANKYLGEKLVMSAHPCLDSAAQSFDALKFITRDSVLQGMTIAANNKRTSILCFEYFKYAGEINPADFVGKTVRCGGTLESVEVNKNNSKVWIARLHITNAFARVMEPK
jgi:hypothetical protein